MLTLPELESENFPMLYCRHRVAENKIYCYLLFTIYETFNAWQYFITHKFRIASLCFWRKNTTKISFKLIFSLVYNFFHNRIK